MCTNVLLTLPRKAEPSFPSKYMTELNNFLLMNRKWRKYVTFRTKSQKALWLLSFSLWFLFLGDNSHHVLKRVIFPDRSMWQGTQVSLPTAKRDLSGVRASCLGRDSSSSSPAIQVTAACAYILTSSSWDTLSHSYPATSFLDSQPTETEWNNMCSQN